MSLTVSSQVRHDNLNLVLPPLYYVLGQSPKSLQMIYILIFYLGCKIFDRTDSKRFENECLCQVAAAALPFAVALMKNSGLPLLSGLETKSGFYREHSIKPKIKYCYTNCIPKLLKRKIPGYSGILKGYGYIS